MTQRTKGALTFCDIAGMKWTYSLLLAGALIFGSCQAQSGQTAATEGQTAPSPSFSNASVSQAQALLATGTYTLIDVRTPGEFAEAHVAGATLIDINGSDFEAGMAALDKSKSYVVICRSGGRSARASQYMVDHGFTQVTNVEGGMNAWLSAGLPSE